MFFVLVPSLSFRSIINYEVLAGFSGILRIIFSENWRVYIAYLQIYYFWSYFYLLLSLFEFNSRIGRSNSNIFSANE